MVESKLNQSHVTELKNLLDSGNRGGFYHHYFVLTGSTQALDQAQISTYSGIWGGLAINGNIYAKENNLNVYDLSLDQFSNEIAYNLLFGIENNINNGGNGFLTADEIQRLDYEVWASKGLGNWFPGNVQLLDDNPWLFFTSPVASPYLLYSGNFIIDLALWTGKRPTDYINLNEYQENKIFNPNNNRYEFQNEQYVVNEGVINGKDLFIIYEKESGKVLLILDKDAGSFLYGYNKSLLDSSFSKDQEKFPELFEKYDEKRQKKREYVGAGLNEGTEKKWNDKDFLTRYCFTAETPILMSDGTYKPIAKIQIGDEVMAFEGLGELQPCKVIATSIKPEQEVIQLGDIKVTPGHQFLLPDGSFQSIGEVDNNGYLVGVTGKLIPHPGVQFVLAKHTVYNITVEGLHTYVAGDYRVHNDSLSNYLPVTTAGIVGASLGGQIASYFADDEFASQLVAQSLGETLAGWVGDAINYEFYRNESLSLSALYTRLPASFIGNAVSLGTAELAESIINAFEIDDPLAQLAVSTVINTTTSYAITHLVASFDPEIAIKFFGAPGLTDAVGNYLTDSAGNYIIDPNFSLSSSLANAGISVVASYAATELYEGLIRWNVLSEDYSVEGSAIGGTIGSVVGGFIGSVIPGIGTVIGSAIGKFLGNILGGLFGDKDYPRAAFLVTIENGEFVSEYSFRRDDGDKRVAEEMANNARDLLNYLVADIGGKLVATGDIYQDGYSYGHYLKKYFYKAYDGSDSSKKERYPHRFDSPQDAIVEGVITQVQDINIEGGDIYIKRLLATLPSEINTIEELTEAFQVAKEYSVYKDNPALYEATIQYLDDNAIQIVDQRILDLRNNLKNIPKLPEDDQFVDFGIKVLPSQVTVSFRAKDTIKQEVLELIEKFKNANPGFNILPSNSATNSAFSKLLNDIERRLTTNGQVVEEDKIFAFVFQNLFNQDSDIINFEDRFIINGKAVKTDQIIRFADGSQFKPVIHQDGSVTLEAEQVTNWLEIQSKAQIYQLDKPQVSDTFASADASRIVISAGRDGDDVLIASNGATLNGKKGNDVYIYSRGKGTVTISDAAGIDVIEFDATVKDKSDLLIEQQGKNLVIAIKDSKKPSATIAQLTNKIIVSNSAQNTIEKVRLGNNKEYLLIDSELIEIAAIDNQLINETYGNDTINTLVEPVSNLVYQPSKALYLDGVNDFVNIGVKASLQVSNSLTLEAWIKPQASSHGVILGREGEYLLAVGEDNKIYYALANSHPGWRWIGTNYSVSLNQWTHIAFTYNQGEIKLYSNGALVYNYQGSGIIGDDHESEDEVRIGNRQDGGNYFKGEIDNVRIWNVARTQVEIQGSLHQTLTGTETGLVGSWNFEEASGNTVNDTSSKKNNGLINGATRTVNSNTAELYQPSKALYFDGVNDYINIGVESSFQMSNSLTLEAWIKPQVKGSNGVIIGREGEYLLAIGEDNKIYYALANSNPGWDWIRTNYTVTLNEWTHIALTYNQGEIKLYSNGALVYNYQGSGTIGDAYEDLNEVRIGNRQHYRSPDYFKGEIDNVRIWNVARTQAEIQGSLQTLSGTKLGLVGAWNLEETSGNIANDTSTNKNSGLINGATRTINNTPSKPYQPSKALYFDGVNDYLNIGVEASLQVSNSLTLEAWIKPQANNHGVIVGREGEYLLAVGEDQKIYYALANSHPGWDWIRTNYSVTLNEWTHIALTYNQGEIKLYSNGALVYHYQGSGTLGDVHANEDEVRIGNRQDGGNHFKGEIDNVRIWNVARTQAEIQGSLQTLSGTKSGLVGSWNFEESSGNLLNDTSTKKNNGLINGATRTVNSNTSELYQPSKALYFDGVNDSVNLGVESSLQVSNSLTLEAWIKPQANNHGVIVGREGEYLLAVGGDNKIYYALANNHPGWDWIRTNYTVTLNEWTHIALTYNQGEIKLYSNGALVYNYQGSGAIGDVHADEDELRIGNRQDGGDHFKGEIDNVRIWNVARTQTQIQANLHQILTGTEPGLIGFWNFEEGSSTVVSDRTSNNNDGTIEGAIRTNNEVFNGKEGNDTYIYNLANGNPSLHDLAITGDGGIDTLQFGETITPENITLQKLDKDLVINFKSNTITIIDYFLPQNQVEIFRFTDGSEYTSTFTANGSIVLQPLLGQSEYTPDTTQLSSKYSLSPYKLAVLDLNGDGIRLISASDSLTQYDIDNDTYPEQIGWVAPTDGFLVRDVNKDGYITTLNEFFSLTPQNNVTRLTTLDSNKDNLINASDTLFNELRIWVDTNLNATVELGELAALQRFGINSISNLPQNKDYTVAGNKITASAYFTRLGFDIRSTAKLHDVQFAYNPEGAKLEQLGNGFAQFNYENKPDIVFADGTALNLTLDLDPAQTYTTTGGEGNDRLTFIAGSSQGGILNGGKGNDTLTGADGNDILTGGEGSDRLFAGKGDDILTIDATDNLNFIDAGEGFDVLVIEGGGNVSLTLNDLNVEVVTGNAGNNALTATGNQTVIMAGGKGHDSLTGGNSSDRLEGNEGNDILNGNDGSDLLLGEQGNDTLNGGKSDDLLDGGAGNDTLTGGTGRDRFSFSNPAHGVDTLTDFSVADDLIEVAAAGFGANLSLGKLAASQFTLINQASTSTQRLIYNGTNGELLFDVDGNGQMAAIKFATLNPNLAITHQNFLIV